MKIIAHAVKDRGTASTALKKGVDFLEIDISKRLFFSKFIIQHNVLIGALGLGPIVDNLLTAELRAKAFLDLKVTPKTSIYTKKLILLLKKLKVKNIKMCGHNWQLISKICHENKSQPFYTLKNKRSLEKFKRQLHILKKPAGFSVHYKLIDKKFMKEFKKKSVEIWAWTVNDIQEIQRLAELKVDGIITDEWRKWSKVLANF